MRKITTLSEGWKFLKADVPAETAVNWAERGETVSLPHTWNAVDGQDGGNDYHRGTCWYVRELTAEETVGERLFLEVNGAAHTCEVWLNGERLARHEGGYSTFRVELSGKLAEKNTLAVSVSNEDSDHVYPQKADFTFYGGLYRAVNLIAVPEEHFELLKDGTPGIKVTPVVDLEKKRQIGRDHRKRRDPDRGALRRVYHRKRSSLGRRGRSLSLYRHGKASL